MSVIIRLIPTLIMIFMLAACGQKGPLYLPTENNGAEPQAEQQSDDEESKRKKKHEADT